jgi:polyisoprenoid-binding protein YceI
MGTTQATASTTTTTTWNIDPVHTSVEFAVKHLMIATVRGHFTDVSGTMTTSGDDFSRAVIEATIGVDSIDTRQPQRDAHLKSPDFFDVANFPTITFRSVSVDDAFGDGSAYRLRGNLTIHGVTKEVVLDATLEGRVNNDGYGNRRAGFSATGRLNRRDFGLTWNQALEAGGVVVGDEVRITIDAEIVTPAE